MEQPGVFDAEDFHAVDERVELSGKHFEHGSNGMEPWVVFPASNSHFVLLATRIREQPLQVSQSPHHSPSFRELRTYIEIDPLAADEIRQLRLQLDNSHLCHNWIRVGEVHLCAR